MVSSRVTWDSAWSYLNPCVVMLRYQQSFCCIPWGSLGCWRTSGVKGPQQPQWTNLGCADELGPGRGTRFSICCCWTHLPLGSDLPIPPPLCSPVPPPHSSLLERDSHWKDWDQEFLNLKYTLSPVGKEIIKGRLLLQSWQQHDRHTRKSGRTPLSISYFQ